MRILIVVLGMVLIAGCFFAALAEEGALTTQKEKVSYSIGLLMGKNLKVQNIDIDADVFIKGFKDSLLGAKPAMTDQEVQQVMTAFQTEMRKKMEEQQKVLGEKNKKEGEAFLTENAKKEGVKVTASGLQYKVLTEGTGKMPAATDEVTVNYRGTLIDGTEFDSSYKRGQPATFKVTQVIPGWTEALKMMKTGSKWQLFIPSKLAYGERQQGGHIGPNATLIFDVELISVKEPTDQKLTKKPEQGTVKTAPKTKEKVKDKTKETAKESADKEAAKNGK